MKVNRSKYVDNNDIDNFLNGVRESIQDSLPYIQKDHEKPLEEIRLTLEEVFFYYERVYGKSVFDKTISFKEFMQYTKGTDASLKRVSKKKISDAKQQYRAGFESANTAHFGRLKSIFEMLALSLDTIFEKSSKYQITIKQYMFLYELIARHNNIFVWSRIDKQYNYNYDGFLELYYKLEDSDRLPLINELRFIVDGLVSVQKPSVLDPSELKNHLLAVTQLPLIEITNSTRSIAKINMPEVLQNPYSLSILEHYHKHLSGLYITIKAFINVSNQKWNEIYKEFSNPDIMKPTTVAEISDGINIFDVDFELEELPDAAYSLFEKILACMKKSDPRFRAAKTLKEFDDINEKIHATQNYTENKLLDEKITKAFRNFFENLSPEDELTFFESIF